MEPRPASSGFPFAIRARLSTEDSSSDASSFIAGDSEDNSGMDESEEEAAEVNAGSLRRPSMPIARVTGDDEDDGVIDELLFDDDYEDEEEEVNPKLVAEKLAAESSDEDFGGGFASGMEASGGFYGNEVKGDNLGYEGPLMVSKEELQVQEMVKERGYVEKVEKMAASIVEGGLDLNDAKVEMDGSKVEEVLDFSAGLCEKIGDFGYGEQNKEFELEVKDLVVDSSIVESGKSNIVGDIDSTQDSDMEVELRALRAESEAAKSVIPEVEDDPVEIVTIKAAGDVASSRHWNEEAEAEDIEEEAGDDIDSKIGFFGEKMLEVSEIEAHSTESEQFEAPNAVGFSHSPILEMVSLHDNKVFEPKDEALCRTVDSVKAKDSSCKLLVLTGYDNVQENHSPSKDFSTEGMMIYSAQYLDDFKEKNDDSVAAVKEIPITENHNICEFTSDNSSSFYADEKEMESIDSFHFSYDEDLAEEDEHEISEWPNSESVKHILKEMEEGSSTLHSGFETSQTYSSILGRQTISNSDEESETDEDDNAKEHFDTSTLAALLRPSNAASSGQVSHFNSQYTYSVNDMNDEETMLYSKVERIRAMYLRLVEKVGMGFIDSVSRGRKIDAKHVTFLYEECEDDFPFSCTILVLGKTGVGKSALINSIFGEERASTNPFQPATTSVREISGVVDGVKLRFIDTPGLLTSLNDQRANMKILSSVKKYIRRFPPDVVLYVDRLDEYNRDFTDLPILRMITRTLGSSIWFNAVIALTHAASVFLDGLDCSSMSYEAVVAQRSKIVQYSIQRAAESKNFMNPVALVENHRCCRRNEDGESLLPNGHRWKPWLLLLCYSSKLLSELNSLMILEISKPKKLFPFHWPHPLALFLSSFLHSNVLNCTKELKNPYFDENDYKIKLFKKKKWKEEIRRLKKMKGGKGGHDEPSSLAADFENPAYIYQFLDPRYQLLIRTVLQTHSWDYVCDYDGVRIDESIEIVNQFPISLAVQNTKDEKEFISHLDSSIKFKHGELGSTLTSLNIQPIGKKKVATGTMVTSMEENLVNGFKLEDQISTGKKLYLVACAGVIRARMNVARGANLEVLFREKDRNSKTTGYNGQISLKMSTTEQVHVALLGLFSLVLSVWRNRNGETK